jgi:tRNA modification GTPase
VLVLSFRAPHSYTGENVAEIQTHGVSSILDKILELLFSKGVRPALPGEFTFRAVMNEKMNLSEAESLQAALSTEGLQASWASKLLGFGEAGRDEIGLRLNALLESISSARGRVEAAIDFPEAESEQAQDVESALKALGRVCEALAGLLSGYENFCRSAGEARVGILGEPNVGKSTLLNLLCGGQKALVSNVAGTTRDLVEARVCLPGGRWVRVFDTAGLRDLDAQSLGHEGVERAGIERGIQAAREATALVWVEKAGVASSSNYASNVQRELAGRPLVRIYSHADEASQPGAAAFDLREPHSRARDYVLRAIEGCLPSSEDLSADFDLVISARQGQLLRAAILEIRDAEDSLHGHRPLELAGQSLRYSEELIRKALGQNVSEDYIGEIFRHFCLGK